MVDNYDEMTQEYKDAERAQFMSEIEEVIEKNFTGSYGFYTRIERDKFMTVIEEQGLEALIAKKFDVLDRVRGLSLHRMSATLSIGVGRDAANLFEAEQMARQALDMCLGRGGDQVAVKTQNGYDFYGGVSKGVEKRTKVKTRIIATALAELIDNSSNVVVMGHRFADLDCFGSCIGMLKSVEAMNKPGVICLDREKNLVAPLLNRLIESGFNQDSIISPERALEKVTPNTLLIVLDTHVSHVLESADVYNACKNVVVIDHHRKLVSYIDNAVIFYHEPYASSASEMVAELIQYFPAHPHITKPEAEAMLAGIMLDTKNFVLRTGVRTFEAAAYLRRLGADTVEVRKLFASTIEDYQQKAAIVANAEIYSRCAIAHIEEQLPNIIIAAPQAADELMTIDGVDASFVIYPYGGGVNVNARSLGSVNVQILMEKLGGGGHQTMAAAQFSDETVENIKTRVVGVIDEFRGDQVQAE
jgi:c-di-AMP phosphodiesterase-like protein